mgnify:CR=1 FL=1
MGRQFLKLPKSSLKWCLSSRKGLENKKQFFKFNGRDKEQLFNAENLKAMNQVKVIDDANGSF